MAKRKIPPAKISTAMPDPVEVLIQYEFVQMVSEHIADLWRCFDGDMAEALVLGVIGQVQLASLLDQDDAAFPNATGQRGISASSISEVCNIPRQTVRRKLLHLQLRGLIRQDDDQRWRLVVRQDGSAPAREVFAELHERGDDRAKRFALALKPYV